MTTWPESIPAALAASSRGGIILHPQGKRISYRQLHETAGRVAAGLHASGLEPGDRVLLVLPTSEDFLNAFYGCALAGVIPAQVSPPEGFGTGSTFDLRIGQLAELVDAQAILAQPKLLPRIEAAAPGRRAVAPETLLELGAAPAEASPNAEGIAFLQFTSGTTHVPKAVTIPHAALSVNTRQIARSTAMNDETVLVSWLPMFHDMGLVGMLTTLFQDAWFPLMTPMSFLRRPQVWLDAISTYRGTHSPAPTFAYRYLVKRLRGKPPEGLDLSSWNTAFVGAEPIHPEALRDFHALLAPLGLSDTTLLPCYGMAEATLALTFKPLGTQFRTLRVDRRALAEAKLATETEDPDGLELVSCGVPLEGTSIRIVDPEGTALGEGRLGEVVVEGPSLFRGYWGQPERTSPELHTGDMGFLQQGELFVTGRTKDLIILRGHNHHPEEVEWVAAQVEGVRPGRVVAFGVSDPREGTEALCVLAERDARAGVEPDELGIEIRRRVHAESGLLIDRLQIAKAGTIPLTTSGKPRRAKAREVFLELQRGSK